MLSSILPNALTCELTRTCVKTRAKAGSFVQEVLSLKHGYLQQRIIAALSQEGAIGQSQAGVPSRCAAGVEDLHAGLELSACPRARGDP